MNTIPDPRYRTERSQRAQEPSAIIEVGEYSANLASSFTSGARRKEAATGRVSTTAIAVNR